MWQKKLSVHPRPDGHHTIPKFTYQFSPQASLSHVPDDHGRRITWRKRSKKSCHSRRRFGRCNPPHLGRVVFPHVSFQNAISRMPSIRNNLVERMTVHSQVTVLAGDFCCDFSGDICCDFAACIKLLVIQIAAESPVVFLHGRFEIAAKSPRNRSKNRSKYRQCKNGPYM